MSSSRIHASRRSPDTASRSWFIGGAAAVALLLFGGFFLARRSGGDEARRRDVDTWFEVRVRTEPPGLPVTLDGSPVEDDVVRFRVDDAPHELVATQDCRTATHRLEPADAGGEVVLVPDPVAIELIAGPESPAARLALNGADLGPSPARLQLDLCRENRIEATAAGYRPASVVIPSGATPLEARTALAGIGLTPLPKGLLRLPELQASLSVYVDGERVRSPEEALEVTEGEHEVRVLDPARWIDVTTVVHVPGDGEALAEIEIPPLATVAVQAFPANCKIYLRKEGGEWRYVDDTPATLRVGAGSYRVRVRFNPTGEMRERDVVLHGGANPALRFSFGTGR